MSLSTKRILIFIIGTILHVHALSQNQPALELYKAGESQVAKNSEKAFRLLENAMKISLQNGEMETYIKSVNLLASINYRGKEEMQDQVFKWLIEAVKILKSSQNTDDLARLHFNVAQYYSDLSQQTDAPIKHFEKAKEIWGSMNGYQKQIADCYHDLGDIYKYSTFDFNTAEKCYEMALLIREQINFQDLPVLYRNYYSLAATNGSQRDFEKALSYGNKATEIVRNLEPHRQEQCAAMVANIYRDKGDSDLAKKYYFNALSLNELTNDLDNKAWYYLCLGEMFKYDSLPKEALYYFKKAYKLYTTPGVKEETLFMNLLINMSDVYSMESTMTKTGVAGSTNENDKNFRGTIRDIFKELDASNMLRSTEAANTWLIVGKHHAYKRRFDSAMFCFQKALMAAVPSFESNDILDNPTEDMIGFQYYVNEILTRKAAALKSNFEVTGKKEYLKESIVCLELAEKLLFKQRNTLDMEDSKWLFLEENFDLYENIIENLYQIRKSLPQDSFNILAFQYFERSKSRSLADALALAEKNKKISNQDSLFRLQSDLKHKLFIAQAQINKGLEKSIESSELSAFRNEVIELDQKLHAVKIAIEDKYPGYFNAMYGYQTVSLDEIRKVITTHKQVLIEYFWGRESVYALCVADDKISFQRIGSPDSIKSLINTLLGHLAEQKSSMDFKRFQKFTASSYELYSILIEPFKLLLKDKDRIQIIPDGSVNQIPFEILLEESSTSTTVNYRSLKYMVKTFSIGYAYSSSMLNHGAPNKKIVSPSMLAMGYTGGAQVRDSNTALATIQGAEKELEALARRFNSGRFLFGAEASEANFKAFAPQSDIIHLAVHGSGDIEKNFAASLYFGSKQDQEDGELHAYELYSLKLKALMAVLSSCESGLGKGYRGEGMISMASAFTHSGCQNILMSLWKVNDQASTNLMDDFYGYLLEGKTIDRALREAKLKYLENADELSADPMIWAPLVAYGSLDQIFSKDRSRIFIYVGVVVVFAILLLSLKNIRKMIRRI